MATESTPCVPGNTATTGWTTETALAHVLALMRAQDQRNEQRFDAQEKAVLSALTAADRAVAKAELASEKRFEGVNEFRDALSDQQRTFIPRLEVEGQLAAVRKESDELKARVNGILSERTGVKGGYGYAVGVAGFVALLLGAVMSLIAFWSKASQ